MRFECGSEVSGAMRDATDVVDAVAWVGGVRWLGGAPEPERAVRPAVPANSAATTFVIGRAHGPRLLELLCAAG